MSNEISPSAGQTPFERIRKQSTEGFDFWMARDLATVLGYSEFRNFEPVLLKAKQACFNSSQEVTDHFVEVHEMVEIGSGAKRKRKNVRLSRYACYLIIQNADPKMAIVAQGQTYFAVQTRRQELAEGTIDESRRIQLRQELETHNKRLAGVAKKAGVVQPLDYAIFQNHGYMGLYGGLTAKDIGTRKGLSKNQKILDHMGSTELAANLFRATQAEEKIKREGISGKDNANRAHYEVGEKVRETIREIGGTMPENLPVAEDIKKIGRKRDKQLKQQP